MQYLSSYMSPIGNIRMASDGEALIGLWFEGQKYDLSIIQEETGIKDLPVFDKTREWLDIYFSGKQPDFTPPLRLSGSVFRQTIGRLMLKIPFGELSTYAELAKEAAQMLGKQHMSAQAVGGAVGHNPISIIVPCHRVVGTDGSLTGYAGGVERKLWLLRNEGIGENTRGLFLPKRGTAL